MAQESTIAVRRLLAEGVAIVVSILLAFAIQAWWDGVRDARDRVTALRQIQADFTTMRAEAHSTLEVQRAHLEASSELLSLIGPQAPTRLARADTLLSIVISGDYREFHGEQGTLTAASGRVEHVRGTRLRTLLAEWPGAVESVATFHSERRILMRSRMQPYLQTRVPIRTFDVEHGGVDGAPSGFRVDVGPLLRELEFENLVNEDVFFTTQTVEQLEAIIDLADEILELLGSELPSGAPPN